MNSNPETPKTPREELELKLTALLLGELPSDQAFLLQEVISRDPELAKLSERLKKTIEMVRDTEHPTEEVSGPEGKKASPAEPLRMGEQKREKLLAHFKTVTPVEFEERPKRGFRLIELVAVVALIGILAALLLPAGSSAKRKATRTWSLASSPSATSADSPYYRSKNSKSSTTLEFAPSLTQDGADFATPSGQDEKRRSLNAGSQEGDHFVARYSFKLIPLPESKDDAAVAAMAVPREPQSAKAADLVAPSTFLGSAVQAGTKVDGSGNRKLGRVELPQIQESQNNLAYQWGNQISASDSLAILTPKRAVNEHQATSGSRINSGYLFTNGAQPWSFSTGDGTKNDPSQKLAEGRDLATPDVGYGFDGLDPLNKKTEVSVKGIVDTTKQSTSSQLTASTENKSTAPKEGDASQVPSPPAPVAVGGGTVNFANTVAANRTTPGKPSTAPAEVLVGEKLSRSAGLQGGGGGGGALRSEPSRTPESLSLVGDSDAIGMLERKPQLQAGQVFTTNGQYPNNNVGDAHFSIDSNTRQFVITSDAPAPDQLAKAPQGATDVGVKGGRRGFAMIGPDDANTLLSVTNITASQFPNFGGFGRGAIAEPQSSNVYSLDIAGYANVAPLSNRVSEQEAFRKRYGVAPSETTELAQRESGLAPDRGDQANSTAAAPNAYARSTGKLRSKSDAKPQPELAPTTGLPIAVADPDVSLAEPLPGSSGVQSFTKSIPGRPLRMPDGTKKDDGRTLEELQRFQQALSMKLAAEGIEEMQPKSAMVQIMDPAQAKEEKPTLGVRLREALGGKVDRSTRIKIDGKQPDVAFATSPVDAAPNAAYDPYFIQTEQEAIRSEAVLGKAVERLGLDKRLAAIRGDTDGKRSKERAIAELRQMIDVKQVPNSHFAEIHAKADKPEEAAKVANAVADAYREFRNEEISRVSQANIKTLQDRYNQIHEKIAKLQAEQQVSRRKETEPAATPKSASTNAAIPQPEIQTAENAFSTFSLNVSDVSFKLAAVSLEKGQLPDPAGIRSEEFINAFDYRDPEPPAGVPVAFAWERAHYPFAQNRDLLRFSIKTAAQGRQTGRPLNIVLLLDNSGSMERADRVQIIHEALKVLASQLNPQDTLSVVTFARTARLWVDGVPGSQAAQVAENLSGLSPEGGTNLEEAMRLAYDTARRHYLATGINRVVLLTDGAANLGNVEPDQLKQSVETHRKEGIALDCFGIGWEGYNDDLLEVLSRNGDGRYGFINTPEEAATEFAGQLAGALEVAASDVKVQVEFNAARVTSYRQIGYAKHQLTKEQFRDNTVDAAEIGAAESGNALYVIEANPAGSGPLATVRVRYKVPGTTDDYREHEWAVPFNGNAVALEQASPAMRLAATASAFSEWLASSPYAAEVSLDRLLAYLSGVPAVYGADVRPQKLEWMIRQASSLAGK